MSEERACQWCGKAFVAKRRDQRFCSVPHQRAAVNKRYHLTKRVDERRPRMSESGLAEQLGELAAKRVGWLDAQARVIEAEQQIALWKQRLAARQAQLVKAKADGGLGMRLTARTLQEGEPVGDIPPNTSAVGLTTTDGLLAVVVFARPV